MLSWKHCNLRLKKIPSKYRIGRNSLTPSNVSAFPITDRCWLMYFDRANFESTSGLKRTSYTIWIARNPNVLSHELSWRTICSHPVDRSETNRGRNLRHLFRQLNLIFVAPQVFISCCINRPHPAFGIDKAGAKSSANVGTDRPDSSG